MSVLLSCVTFRRLSVVISSIDGYVAVFVLYADSQTYTQAHSESQWHVLPLQHLIFHISLSLSLFYIFAARLTCFLCCAVSVSFCCPCSHQLVVLPPPLTHHHHHHHHRVSLSRQSSSALGSPVLIYCQIFQDYQ